MIKKNHLFDLMFKGQDHIDLIFIYKNPSCSGLIQTQTSFEGIGH